jgi:hypothetical protein
MNFLIAGHELGARVGDDSRFGVRIFFQAALEDDLNAASVMASRSSQ